MSLATLAAAGAAMQTQMTTPAAATTGMSAASATPSSELAYYNRNLAAPEIYWGTVLSNDRVPYSAGRGLVSTGPFYIDTNHREGALLVGPLVIWVNNTSSPDSPHIPIGRIDLRNTRIQFRLRLDYQPTPMEFNALAGGQLVFWFQSALQRRAVSGGDGAMPPRTVNYFLNQNFLDETLKNDSVSVDISPDLNAWSCLGTNPIDLRPTIGSATKYTCALDQAEFESAMARPANMGFIFVLPERSSDGADIEWLNSNFPVRTLAVPQMALTLSEFKISAR